MPFDLHAAWALSPRVAIRPERFGALAYDFGTRRLSFLKTPELRHLVEALGDQPDALAACRAVGIPDDERPRYERSLAALAETGTIVRREQE